MVADRTRSGGIDAFTGRQFRCSELSADNALLSSSPAKETCLAAGKEDAHCRLMSAIADRSPDDVLQRRLACKSLSAEDQIFWA